MTLDQQIWQIDEQFERFEAQARHLEQEIYRTGYIRGGACGLLRIRQARRLQEIYKTGRIPRPRLPPRPVRPVEIPLDLLVGRPTDSATVEAKAYPEIPDDVLWPKRKRGRPRNETLAALAKSQECTERHARRFLASGKQRKRGRKSPSPDEEWAFQQREKRAQLVQALNHENGLNRIAWTLEILNRGCAGSSSEVTAKVRELAERMVAKEGIATVLLMCNFALQRIGLRFALKALGCSRSTVYRKFGGRLDSLRTNGEKLREYDLSQVIDAQICPKPRRPLTEGSKNAWSVQTTWSPENFRVLY